MRLSHGAEREPRAGALCWGHVLAEARVLLLDQGDLVVAGEGLGLTFAFPAPASTLQKGGHFISSFASLPPRADWWQPCCAHLCVCLTSLPFPVLILSTHWDACHLSHSPLGGQPRRAGMAGPPAVPPSPTVSSPCGWLPGP